MRSLLAICLILVCYADKTYATFADFMNNLPSEIAGAFSTAWSSLTDAIKKPVRLKRLGPGGRLKSTTTTKKPGNLGHEPLHNDHKTQPHSKEHFSTKYRQRVTIPVLPTPKFRSLDDWRSMQQAYYAKKKIDKQSKYSISPNKVAHLYTKYNYKQNNHL